MSLAHNNMEIFNDSHIVYKQNHYIQNVNIVIKNYQNVHKIDLALKNQSAIIQIVEYG